MPQGNGVLETGGIAKVAFPDGTSTSFGYQLLDLASITDRLGQTTLTAHDSERRVIGIAHDRTGCGSGSLSVARRIAATPSRRCDRISDCGGHGRIGTGNGAP